MYGCGKFECERQLEKNDREIFSPNSCFEQYNIITQKLYKNVLCEDGLGFKAGSDPNLKSNCCLKKRKPTHPG